MAVRAREPKTTASTDPVARTFSTCRVMGHRWGDTLTVGPEVNPPYGSNGTRGFLDICHHCATERTSWISRYGHTVIRRYRYPDQYTRRGDDALSRAEWRRTWIVTMLGDDA